MVCGLMGVLSLIAFVGMAQANRKTKQLNPHYSNKDMLRLFEMFAPNHQYQKVKKLIEQHEGKTNQPKTDVQIAREVQWMIED